MPSIGQRVKLHKHPHQPIGKVVDINRQMDTVIVEWEDRNLIPSRETYPHYAFVDGTFIYVQSEFRSIYGECECGSEKTYGKNAFHSDWCPKNENLP